MEQQLNEQQVATLTEIGISREQFEERAAAFVQEFNWMTQAVYKMAVAKGWWAEERNGGPQRNLGEMLFLTFTELAEGYEGWRTGQERSDKIPEFEPMEEEIADAFIRLMDLSGGRGWSISEALVEKFIFNAGRAYRHGNKKA